ncbi:hypothetical protein KRMM14A1004_31720 [Krasilnikovia sp. MM14-A1004]
MCPPWRSSTGVTVSGGRTSRTTSREPSRDARSSADHTTYQATEGWGRCRRRHETLLVVLSLPSPTLMPGPEAPDIDAAAAYRSGWRRDRFIAQNPPAENPIAPHAARSVRIRRWAAAYAGTSVVRNVSDCAPPVRFVHSVSRKCRGVMYGNSTTVGAIRPEAIS